VTILEVEGKQLLIQVYAFLASASNPASSCYKPQSISTPILVRHRWAYEGPHTTWQSRSPVVTFGGKGWQPNQ